MICDLCPRFCHVDRTKQTGYCGMPEELFAARAALHMWEEPCISGSKGSGAVFFTGCNLRCVFCQNRDIAQGKQGKQIDKDRLADIFLKLQEQGANNINLVTPTHYVYIIVPAVEKARTQGLQIPIVYNCGGYENVETLKKLEGIVDIYLPDFKYFDSTLAAQYSHAADYPEVAKRALAEMVRQQPEPVFAGKDEAQKMNIEPDMMLRGVIVRHLLLPEHTKDSRRVIHYLYDTYQDAVFVSIMNQYTPLSFVKDIPPLNRKVTIKEYNTVVDDAIDYGVVNGFIQEGKTAEESFIPSFDFTGIL